MFMGDVEIKVTVFDVSGGKAKLAISAPEEVKIYRSELVEEE
jgi:carbon storage regulator CsrA